MSPIAWRRRTWRGPVTPLRQPSISPVGEVLHGSSEAPDACDPGLPPIPVTDAVPSPGFPVAAQSAVRRPGIRVAHRTNAPRPRRARQIRSGTADSQGSRRARASWGWPRPGLRQSGDRDFHVLRGHDHHSARRDLKGGHVSDGRVRNLDTHAANVPRPDTVVGQTQPTGELRSRQGVPADSPAGDPEPQAVSAP